MCTIRDIEAAILELDFVRDVIVEDHESRKRVPVGYVRVTVNGGVADEIAARIEEVLPVAVITCGFSWSYANGVSIRFDHVNPDVRQPESRPWYRRLFEWLRGRR